MWGRDKNMGAALGQAVEAKRTTHHELNQKKNVPCKNGKVSGSKTGDWGQQGVDKQLRMRVAKICGGPDTKIKKMVCI